MNETQKPGAAQDEREAFESWASRECVCDLRRNQFGVYRSAGVENWWIGWQARATRPALTELVSLPRELVERCVDRWACCSMATTPGAEQAWSDLRGTLAQYAKE